jgi:(3S)-malyl-CoA thioesterase
MARGYDDPYRSVLYIPAANARAMEKARDLPADAIIFDLEDAVTPAEKVAARDLLARALLSDYGGRARIVRINGLDTEWGEADARAFARSADAVLIPKVGRGADLDRAASLIPGTPLWAMMETPAGMLHAAEIAAHPRLAGMVMGSNDLAKDLHARFRPDRLPLMTGLGLCLLAARAHGRIILDGVYNAYRDLPGLRAECEQGRDMGFDGKTLIHPDQLAIANEVFAPSRTRSCWPGARSPGFRPGPRPGQGHRRAGRAHRREPACRDRPRHAWPWPRRLPRAPHVTR